MSIIMFACYLTDSGLIGERAPFVEVCFVEECGRKCVSMRLQPPAGLSRTPGF